MMTEPAVSVTSHWMAEGRYRSGVGEELGSPGWGLLQREMEGAQAKERSKEVRAGSCRPFAAGRPGTDRLEEEGEATKGQGLIGQGIYDHRH